MVLRGLMLMQILALAGCSAIPQILHEPQYHNPLPQLTRVAVLPFFNQSDSQNVDQDRIAIAYYNELQKIPGFEVVPVGVTKQYLVAWQRSQQSRAFSPPQTGMALSSQTGTSSHAGTESKAGAKSNAGADSQTTTASHTATASHTTTTSQTATDDNPNADGADAEQNRMPLRAYEPRTGEDFQQLAQFMDVDAIVVGSVTEFSPYYPPRLGLSVRWYAANPSFHPVPPGYGLPWGTADEKHIPERTVLEAEFALAREQLKTQTPNMPASGSSPAAEGDAPADSSATAQPTQPRSSEPARSSEPGSDLPPDWPDPRGFVPAAPSAAKPPCLAQHEPVLTHTRLYHGNDADFTRQLASYYAIQDESRFGGWQGYLQRSDDFIRFCCYLHITEMLSERGGEGKTRVVWRWPIGRYEP